MSKTIEQQTADQTELELIVDRHGLGAVLTMLESICCEKAGHVSTNYQDESLAKSWERDASKIGRLNVAN